ncbi:phage tail sheath C-terminal domain-containing protein [uncultured Rhodospira sp.]|uniref:phage tail sheath C-terminal domain-containing protein n=1 Tax=uncultured Rhodospira sp. TaxID=1936189 RepID=UPI00262C0C77|nr:phage tail sheath C-terminal domain-containing protein [uncultured Rhodospira sp.]
MSESIGEMILPGTYIEVRAEGLIGVGGIATGNIGIVGTANRGPLNQVVVLGSYADALAVFGTYDAWPDDPAASAHLTLVRTLEQAFRGGASTVHAVRVANLAEGVTMNAMSWTVATGGTPAFTLTATSPGTWANDITVAIQAATDTDPIRLTLTHGRQRETHEAADAESLAREVNSESALVRAGAVEAGQEGAQPDTVTAATGNDVGGPDGAGAMGALIPQIAEGLALLESRAVNILLVAGYGADTVAGTVLAHLERTENDGRERIAILGTRGDSLAEVAQDSNAVSNKRIVLVAPGIEAGDAADNGASVDLPPAYAAALVAGRLSGLAPHISLTNKDVPASGLTTVYSRAQQKVLLGNRIMVLMQNLGFRALRGITTDTGAFTQISVRRIVDYAKAGVRKGANPYIGRLNNIRVRAALKATLDGFLAQMVQDEMLVSYELDVSATRAQEINGIAAVTLTLRPTFSIDFVRVTMILE